MPTLTPSIEAAAATAPTAPTAPAATATVTHTPATVPTKAVNTRKVAAKTVAKTVAKTAPKVAVARKPTAKAAPVAAKKPAARKAAEVAKAPVPVAVAPLTAKAPAKAKPKLVRDSFTMPKAEYAVIDELKQRAAKLGRPAKKSELLRAGVKALNAMGDDVLRAALSAVPTIKTGRPHKG
jgi:hypothetical protein